MKKPVRSTLRRLSKKNQIAIPVLFLRFLHIEAPSIMEVDVEDNRIILTVAEDPIKKVRGHLKGKTDKTAMEILREAREEELQFEKKKLQKYQP
jgi:bifunctional DNA-binding transcriptional regulator/antitoxin component of YhaV-PrlF toxin-antitoxin module